MQRSAFGRPGLFAGASYAGRDASRDSLCKEPLMIQDQCQLEALVASRQRRQQDLLSAGMAKRYFVSYQRIFASLEFLEQFACKEVDKPRPDPIWHA